MLRSFFRVFPNKISYTYKPSRLHEQEMLKNKDFDQRRKQELLYNAGIYGIVFALCWAAIPFYKLFCQHFGLEGNVEQKDYSEKVKKSKLNMMRKYKLNFQAEMDPKANWEFEPIQNQIIVHAGETALVFYRAYNKEEKPIVGFSTYQMFPEDASLYFSKIQCFCFNQQMLNPKEELLLPILFYLEPEINQDPNLKNIQEINIQYRFFKSKKQDLAEMADEELKRIKRNKMILMRMRSKEGLTDEEFNKIRDMEIPDNEIEEMSEYEYEQKLAANK